MRTAGLKKEMFPEEYQCLRRQKNHKHKNQICRVSILFTTDRVTKLRVPAEGHKTEKDQALEQACCERGSQGLASAHQLLPRFFVLALISFLRNQTPEPLGTGRFPSASLLLPCR